MLKFSGIRGYPAIKKITGLIIQEIPGPDFKRDRIMAHSVDQCTRGIHQIHERTAQFGRVSETFPVAAPTVILEKRRLLEIPIFSHIFFPAVPTGECVSVLCVNEKIVLPAKAGSRCFGKAKVLFFKHVKGNRRGKYPQPMTEIFYRMPESPENHGFFISGIPNDAVRRTGLINC